jgi:hypothetical protein
MRYWLVTLPVVVVLLYAGPALAATCEVEEAGPSPAGTTGLAELQANADRPALTLDLAGLKSDSDDVTLATKGDASVASDPQKVDPNDATTDIRDSPRKANDRLDGNVVTSATTRRGNKSVRIDICVDSASTWQAGTYEGTVTIDGPRLQQFSYPIVIKKKWPWWTAFVVLVLVVLGYIAYAAGQGNAPAAKTKTGSIRTKLVYFAVSAAGGLLVYWSVYVKNETWGENPAADIAALALAGVTGAIGGGTAARAAFAQIDAAEQQQADGGGGEEQAGGGGGEEQAGGGVQPAR